MLSGAYLLSDDAGPYAVERFRCGDLGDGWTYDAVREHPETAVATGRIELHLTGAATRLHVEAGGWLLRGAAAGGEVLWRRGEQEHRVRGDGFAGSSPGLLLVAARLERDLLQLVELTEPVLATRTTRQAWRAHLEHDQDGVRVRRYDVDDLATGVRRTLHLSGDVVVDAPGVVLRELSLGAG